MRDMISDKEFFDGLSVRARKVLERVGAKSMAEVGSMTFDQLAGVWQCGMTTQKEIVNGLAVANGVSFDWAWPRVSSHQIPMIQAMTAKSSLTQGAVEAPFGYQKCGTCRFWDQWKDDEFLDIGCCVRHAPIPVIDPNDDTTDPSATWPTTNKENRCGEWKLNLL